MILQEGDFNYKEQIAYRIRDFYYNLSEIIDLDIEKNDNQNNTRNNYKQ